VKLFVKQQRYHYKQFNEGEASFVAKLFHPPCEPGKQLPSSALPCTPGLHPLRLLHRQHGPGSLARWNENLVLLVADQT
jgi:hypothetical protein